MTAAATAVAVAAHFGDAASPRAAAVLGPAAAWWDDGRFLEPLLPPLLAAGHRVTVYDTLSLLRDGDDLPALAARWASVLADGPPTDLLAGNALGGAVVQGLLAHPLAARSRVLLLSAPTRADGRLNRSLEEVAAAVAADGLPAALDLLHELVSGPAGPPPVTVPSGTPGGEREQAAGNRLARGLRLLHDLDLRHLTTAHRGPLLHLYGARSRLVGRRHLAAAAHHRITAIPGAGMRPHADRPDLTRLAVTTFLREEETHDET